MSLSTRCRQLQKDTTVFLNGGFRHTLTSSNSKHHFMQMIIMLIVAYLIRINVIKYDNTIEIEIKALSQTF